MSKKDIPAYKFLINLFPNQYYPYENFDGLSLSEIGTVLNKRTPFTVSLLCVIDTTSVINQENNAYEKFYTVWRKNIVLNFSEQSINDKIVSEPEDNKYYNCFVNRYCKEEIKEKEKAKAKVKEKGHLPGVTEWV